MRLFLRVFCILCTVITFTIFSVIFQVDKNIPSNFYTKYSTNFDINIDNITVSVDGGQNILDVTEELYHGINYQLKLFNLIPIKNINVKKTDEVKLSPSGRPFGIKIITDGVLVVGESEVKTKDGFVKPYEKAGIYSGDVLKSINDTLVYSNNDIKNIVTHSNGNPLKLTFFSGDDEKISYITPVLSEEDKTYKIGIWVRDSSAGIGTMTFTVPEKNIFAGLGHGVNDADTGKLLPIRQGKIVDVQISNIEKSKDGSPGELKGSFKTVDSIGNIQLNSNIGVYGSFEGGFDNYFSEPIPMKFKQEVKKGKAQIITTIDENGPKYYDINIQKIDFNKDKIERNMVIEVVDEDLLSKTGGIVQGMSGSPIIQDGKIIGALTHVFVNDIKKGYAIFAESMFTMLSSIQK